MSIVKTEKYNCCPKIVPLENYEEITVNDLPKTIPTKRYYVSSGIFGVHVTVDDSGWSYELLSGDYDGDSPDDLARSILADCAEMKVADAFYQDFKREFIACMPRDGFIIPEEAIREWLKEKVKEAY